MAGSCVAPRRAQRALRGRKYMPASGPASARDVFSTLCGCLVSAAAPPVPFGLWQTNTTEEFWGVPASILKRRQGRGETGRGRRAAQTPSEMC